MGRVLVVDDEAPLRETLSAILEAAGHEVRMAADGFEALQALESFDAELVLSDIFMPGMDGIALLKRVAEVKPSAHRVLITAHNVDDYIRVLRDERLSSVLTKTVPFPAQEVRETVNSLLTRSIFGLTRHMAADAKVQTHFIRTPGDIDDTADQLAKAYPESHEKNLKMVLMELLTNAVYYGIRGEAGDSKEKWVRQFELTEADQVVVESAEDSEKFGVGITDLGGRLRRETVLFWLDRQLSRDPNGLPIGVLDKHGRGLFISRYFTDRLIINIERDMRCEVIVLMYKRSLPAGYKPLLIHEI